MFSHSPKIDEHSYTFIAGFHLGVPLAVAHTFKSTGWTQINRELFESFSRSTAFQPISVEHDPVTKFPLGNPLVLQYVNFYNIFDLPRFCRDKSISLQPDEFTLEHEIWICPVGIVLILGTMSFKKAPLLKFKEFEEVIEYHYAELANVFSELAGALYDYFPPKLLTSSICSSTDIKKCRNWNSLRSRFFTAKQMCFEDLQRFLAEDEHRRTLLDDILVDVYYIDFSVARDHEQFRIDYVDSSIVTSDPFHIQIISIAYSLFVSLLWIQKHLNEQSQLLEKGLIGALPLREEMAFDLKLFRIFCLQFINEANPISIRLTHIYMERIEEFWQMSRLKLLSDQVNDQLATLVQMFDWIEDFKKEIRNVKVGLAAVLLALISVAAVAAQLISTIDVNSQWGANERVSFILIGFTTGVLSTFIIYLLPVARWRTQLRIRGRRDQQDR